MTDHGSSRIVFFSLIFFSLGFFLPSYGAEAIGNTGVHSTVILPPPELQGSISLEESIYARRSIRRFTNQPLNLREIGQLLWAAGGRTIDGLTGATRAYPSAGGIYPLNILLAAGNVTGLHPGLYRYNWKKHSLSLLKTGDIRPELTRAGGGQQSIASAPIAIIISGDMERGVNRYGSRAETRYIPMDTGHAGQNISLQAQALGLGSVIVGAFNDEAVKAVIGLKGETPLCIIPVGREEK
jgi:SagB-type dehydrogenase family enzyme